MSKNKKDAVRQPSSSGKSVKRKKKPEPSKQKSKRITTILSMVLVGISAIMVVALGINTVNAGKAGTVDNQGTEDSMTAKTGKSMKNDLYVIGNNPTELYKESFQQLTDAISSGTPEEKAEAVVYNFVNDYFTWTNKDGNYEIGGLQYIYSEKYSKFEEWNRWYHQANMDLYISQYGREHLPEVASIKTDVPTFRTDDFTVLSVDPVQTYPCYQVEVSWTWGDNATVDLNDFPHRMRFQVVDHDGRFEIVEFYDMDSVEAWEAQNGSGSDSETSSEGGES